MGIPKLLEDLAIISKLGDTPGTDNGLSASAFKAKFDEAALKIQEYINNTIVPAIGATASPENGLSMKANIAMNDYRLTDLGTPTEAKHAATKEYVDNKAKSGSVSLPYTSWSNNRVSVTVPTVTPSNDVDVSPAPESYLEYTASNVRCVAQSYGGLAFECDTIPSANLTVNVRVWD